MKFNDNYNKRISIFEKAKGKKATSKKTTKKSSTKNKKETVDSNDTLDTDKLIFPTEERAILNLGDTIAVVVKNMGDIEQEIKDAVKAKDKAKADQLERQIDDYKDKLEQLTAAEKKAVQYLNDKIDELLKSATEPEEKDLLTSVKKKYK